jgi:hypothetical protein
MIGEWFLISCALFALGVAVYLFKHFRTAFLSPGTMPIADAMEGRWSILDDKRAQEEIRRQEQVEEYRAAFTAIEGIIHRARGWEDERTDEDLEFELSFYKRFGESVEYAFYTTIAGTRHKNPDGTSRIAAIKRCEMLDVLDLVPDPENEFDKNAIGVVSAAWEQLGYLEARLAGEVSRGIARGEEYTALFRHRNYHNDRVVGGLILLCRHRPSV